MREQLKKDHDAEEIDGGIFDLSQPNLNEVQSRESITSASKQRTTDHLDQLKDQEVDKLADSM